MSFRWSYPIIGVVVLMSAACSQTDAWAQQSEDLPVSTLRAATASPPVTAPLEERIAAARSVKVMTSILDIELGSALDEAHEKLDKLCSPGIPPKEEGDDGDKKGHDGEERSKKLGGEKEPLEHKPDAGEEREEGHKVLWQLAGTDYSAIYITADDKEHIESITGFLRPDKHLSFERIGEVSKAPVKDDNSVVWDVLRPGQPLSRVVARGSNGKANSIRLFVVRQKSGGTIFYKGK